MANIQTLALSGFEIKDFTGWPDPMIEDYLTITRNINAVLVELNQNIENIESIENLTARNIGQVNSLRAAIRRVRKEFIAIGHGGLSNSTNAGEPNITAAWQTVGAFDGGYSSSPDNVIQEDISDGVRFLKAGIWNADISLPMTFTGVAGIRILNFRIYNQTQATDVVYFPETLIDDGSGMGNIKSNIDFEVPNIRLNDLYVLQVQTPSADFTGVTYRGGNMVFKLGSGDL